METLPDYLREGLDIVLVGLNPSVYSVEAGHYFANPRNRFWKALNLSGLASAELSPELDRSLPDYGIGLTDVVKRPTSQAAGLSQGDFRRWIPLLREKLERYQPLVVCFHGLMAYRQYDKYTNGKRGDMGLGLQTHDIGTSKVFVVPNPSAANARFSVDDLVRWYDELALLRENLKRISVRK